MAANSPESTTPSLASSGGNRLRNFVIAIVAIALSAALFLGIRTQAPTATLDTLAASSTPLEVALNNQKPTLIEFYANWCTSCQAMAKDLGELKQQYADKLNFVMLNVDNSKWLPEIMQYRVDGIPHFVYVGKDGGDIAQAVGEIPRSIMAANLDALVANLPLPHTQASGQASEFTAPTAPSKPSTTDPRSHSSQVKT
jgi:thiol-disulfide isomerase/thioredoxin